MRTEPEFVGVAIILVGEFNPTIFAPQWFSANGLLPEGAVEGADVQVVHPDLTRFSTDWMQLQVTKGQFMARSAQAPFVRLRDIVHRTFDEHLFHTPLRAFGINFFVHFLVDSLATRSHMHNTLAPLDPWGPWRERLNLDGQHGGMTALRMTQANPSDREDGGAVNVVVEPSAVVENDSGRGVYVQVNDHFAGSAESLGSAEKLMAVLATEFEGSLQRSQGIVDHIMSLADTARKQDNQ